MAVTATPVFAQAPKMGLSAYTTASSTVTHVTGGTNGSKILSLTVVSNSTSAHVFSALVSTGGSGVPIGAASITASAGSNGSTPAINMLSTAFIPGLPIDPNGNTYLFLPSTNHTLTLLASAAINTGKQVSFASVVEDF
jgi:hypothetical protein